MKNKELREIEEKVEKVMGVARVADGLIKGALLGLILILLWNGKYLEVLIIFNNFVIITIYGAVKKIEAYTDNNTNAIKGLMEVLTGLLHALKSLGDEPKGGKKK